MPEKWGCLEIHRRQQPWCESSRFHGHWRWRPHISNGFRVRRLRNGVKKIFMFLFVSFFPFENPTLSTNSFLFIQMWNFAFRVSCLYGRPTCQVLFFRAVSMPSIIVIWARCVRPFMGNLQWPMVYMDFQLCTHYADCKSIPTQYRCRSIVIKDKRTWFCMWRIYLQMEFWNSVWYIMRWQRKTHRPALLMPAGNRVLSIRLICCTDPIDVARRRKPESWTRRRREIRFALDRSAGLHDRCRLQPASDATL